MDAVRGPVGIRARQITAVLFMTVLSLPAYAEVGPISPVFPANNSSLRPKWFTDCTDDRGITTRIIWECDGRCDDPVEAVDQGPVAVEHHQAERRLRRHGSSPLIGSSVLSGSKPKKLQLRSI